MAGKRRNYYVGDFETTVYEGQEETEVWASGLTELYSPDEPFITNSIDSTYDYIVNKKQSMIIYYHNLKFDGSFWLDFLLLKKGFRNAFIEDSAVLEWKEDKDLKNGEIKYNISKFGLWYYIIFKVNGRLIELRDSLKLLPFKAETIAEDFKLDVKKLSIEYKGERKAGGIITDEEKAYLINDLMIIRKGLEIMFEMKFNKITIGACCMKEFKDEFFKNEYKELFPNLYENIIDSSYGALTEGEYVRRAYHGGWTYLVEGKERKKHHNGQTFDVNSLYPSMMSSESDNFYPVGKGTFWRGEIPIEAKANNIYYFVRFTCRFNIKPGFLPWVQIKGDFRYNGREMLKTSDIYDITTNKYYEYVINDGIKEKNYVTLTMTCTDFELFKKHYDIEDLIIHDGVYYKSFKGLFDSYIYRFRKMKMENKGAKRQIAKLLLNSLYGRFATSTDSTFKITVKDSDGLRYETIPQNDKEPGYIPIGAAITSYSRRFTITAAQANYYGADKKGFIYADTDSIHTDLPIEEIKGIEIDETEFCKWKMESEWSEGWFLRAKSYAEKIDGEWVIKCAGMTEAAKNNFLSTMKDISEFDKGLKVPGKLMAKRIKGGTILVDTYFEIR